MYTPGESTHLAPGTSDGTLRPSQKNINNSENTIEALETKLAINRSCSIIELSKETMIESHLSTIKALTMEADQLMQTVQEQKNAENLNQWNASVDAKNFAADESIKILKTTLEEFHQKKEWKKQDKELDFERSCSKPS